MWRGCRLRISSAVPYFLPAPRSYQSGLLQLFRIYQRKHPSEGVVEVDLAFQREEFFSHVCFAIPNCSISFHPEAFASTARKALSRISSRGYSFMAWILASSNSLKIRMKRFMIFFCGEKLSAVIPEDEMMFRYSDIGLQIVAIVILICLKHTICNFL